MFEKSLLADTRILVTGGGSGLGLAMARRCAELGATVYLCGRREGVVQEAAADIVADGGRAVGLACDIKSGESVEAMLDRIWADGGPLTGLVNNAAGNFICRAEDLSPNGWNAVIGIVLNGSFYCSRAVGQYMIAKQRGGSIVSILANYVWTGSPGTIHSAAAKAGVMSMTQTLAAEWAPHGIRVNAVAPGPIEASPGAARQLWSSPAAIDRITATIPLKRWGRPEEVADAVAFLAAPQSGFITGEILTVDGGTWIGKGPYGFIEPGSPQ